MNKLLFYDINENYYNFLENKLKNLKNIGLLYLIDNNNLFNKNKLNLDIKIKKVSINVKDVKLQKNALIFIISNNNFFVDEALQYFIDEEDLTIIAPKINPNSLSKPLFIITIPKSGTHLLIGLLENMGYYFDPHSNDPHRFVLKNNTYSFLEYTNSHTLAKDFFIDSVRKGYHGNRLHPFKSSISLFMYRHPLDILSSESNYYGKKGKTIFYDYFKNKTNNMVLTDLISESGILGSIRERINNYKYWLDFSNVIPISFEELIGSKGGGSDKLRNKLIWSLQLKLKIPGSPENYGKNIFNEKSPTFNQGLIGRWYSFPKNILNKIKKINTDYLTNFGYSLNKNSKYSTKINSFRNKKINTQELIHNDEPVLIKSKSRFNIVFFQNQFHAIHQSLKNVDLAEKNNHLKFKKYNQKYFVSENLDNIESRITSVSSGFLYNFVKSIKNKMK